MSSRIAHALFAVVTVLAGITAGAWYLMQNSAVPDVSLDPVMSGIWAVILYILHIPSSVEDNLVNNPINSAVLFAGIGLGIWAGNGLGLFSALWNHRKL